jgi:hypothetical protein
MTEEHPPAPIVWPPLEDELQKWRKWHAERAAGRERAKAELRHQERQILAERAAASQPVGFSEFQTDVLGEVLSHERQLMRDYVDEQLGLLRAEFTIAKAHDAGRVLDLPRLPLRKRS